MQLEAQVAEVSRFITGKLNVKPGDRIVLSFPPGPKFLSCIMACFAAGVIAGAHHLELQHKFCPACYSLPTVTPEPALLSAVPVYPPNPASFQKDMDRLSLIAKTSGASMALTSSDYQLVITAVRWKNILTLKGGGAAVAWKAVPESCFSAKPSTARLLQPHTVAPSDVAFLQFTSGSTGDPKVGGVICRGLQGRTR